MKKLLLFLLVIFAINTSTFSQKQPGKLTGKVIHIVDGDTFDLLTEDTVKIRIRLNGIDCPERKQDYYQVCKDALSTYIFGKDVTLITHGKDRWKRVIADVYMNKEYINLKMVENGFAWHFKKYSKDINLAKAEENARKKKAGIWKMKNPEAPWNYRKPVKKSKPIGKNNFKNYLNFYNS